MSAAPPGPSRLAPMPPSEELLAEEFWPGSGLGELGIVDADTVEGSNAGVDEEMDCLRIVRKPRAAEAAMVRDWQDARQRGDSTQKDGADERMR